MSRARERTRRRKLMEKFIPSSSFSQNTHTHSEFIIMGRNSSTKFCSVFFIFLFPHSLSFWNDSTIKTNLNWSGEISLSLSLTFLLTALSLTPSYEFYPKIYDIELNSSHSLVENNSQVDISRGAFIELSDDDC